MLSRALIFILSTLFASWLVWLGFQWIHVGFGLNPWIAFPLAFILYAAPHICAIYAANRMTCAVTELLENIENHKKLDEVNNKIIRIFSKQDDLLEFGIEAVQDVMKVINTPGKKKLSEVMETQHPDECTCLKCNDYSIKDITGDDNVASVSIKAVNAYKINTCEKPWCDKCNHPEGYYECQHPIIDSPCPRKVPDPPPRPK